MLCRMTKSGASVGSMKIKLAVVFSVVVLLITEGCGGASSATDGFSGPSVDVFRPTWTPTHAYYVDANLGSDSNDASSPSKAWKTLFMIHSVVLVPGEVVYLARGSVWTNQQILLDNNSAGSAQKPVVFEAYGDAAKAPPTIDTPYALWSTLGNPVPYDAVDIGGGSSYITMLDLLIKNVSGTFTAFSIDETSDHIVIAGNEVDNADSGVVLAGQHQKILSNYFHDIGKGGGNSGIGIGFVGQDLEMGWNRFERCRLWKQDQDLPLGGYDGGAFEFYGLEPKAGVYDVSNNISIHHNRIDSSVDFMESYGAVTNMLIAYNVYSNSENEALEFHFDVGYSWGDQNNHPLYYDVRIENNTFMPLLTAAVMPPDPSDNFGGWGIIGLLVDPVPANNQDDSKSHISFRNNIFVSNYKIITQDGMANLVHDHNIYYFPSSGYFDNDGNADMTASEKIANPLFVNASPASLNLQLQSTSPARGVGVNLGYAQDVLQKPVPTSGAPDIGAYQF